MDLEGQHAIRLIEVNASGKYVLSEEGKAFISKIQGPIAVISVAGMYRTGKSYLLNRMILNRSNGFGVGPTVNPCTKGLWCWGKTISGKTPDGETVNVIVIDTQGIGALDEDQTHDTRIFTLAILAASAFIYNSTGSIDENALQNLSLVVNLTKNIQLNTNTSEEEDDPEELANFFPCFFWVVRDFSLQLINAEGEQITPKEYLERALAPQKGFSDDVEQKNRIRRLLTSFFKERQCFTLVRPLVDEKKLQNLDQLDLDSLRPEFVDQVMNFRRRILGRIKPKIFKGKQLDGPMYLCLLNSYVTAINNGAVPNIQNAWNYMCQEKCAQAFEYSLNFFNEEAEKSVKSAFPAEEQFLLDQLKELKQKACELFEVNSVGDKTKFHLKQLRENLEHKTELLKAENERLSVNMLMSYFKKSIVDIESKLRLRQYGTFDEFMKELNQFYANLLENGPVLPKKQAVFLSMLKKVIPAAADIFLKDKAQQFKNYKAIAEDKQSIARSSIEQMKKQQKESEERNKEKITKIDREKIELQLELEDLRKAVDQMRQKMSMQSQKYQHQLKLITEQSKKKQELLNQKVSGLNQQILQLQNELSSLKFQQEKESALLTFKNKQLISEIEEIRKKEAQIALSFRNLQISSSENIKNSTEQFQKKIKEKDVELRQLKSNLTEIEQQNKLLENQIQIQKAQDQDQISKLKYQLTKRENQLACATRERQQSEKEIKESTGDQILKLKQELQKNNQRYNEIEKQLKTQTQMLSVKQRNYETELVLMRQKIQFTQVEAKEYKNQLLKAKKEHQDKIATLEEQHALRQDQSGKLEQQAQAYDARISQLKIESEQNIKKLSNQVQNLTKQLNDSVLEVKSLKSKHQIQIQQSMRLIADLKQQLEGQQGTQEQRITMMKQQWKVKEKSYVEKIEKLNNQMEQIKQQMLRQQRQEHEKSEQVVLQLKNYYEIQKEKLQNKIVHEKEKHERKLGEIQAQYEEKSRQQIMELESEYQFIKQKFSEVEDQLNKERSNRKIEIDIKNKHIENLQKTLEEMKGKIDNKEVELLNKIDRLQKEQSGQKQSLHSKIQELLTKQSKAEKQRSNLSHAKEQLQKILQMREKSIEELKQELTLLKQKIQNQKQNQKLARSDMSTKLMEQRVEFEKKTALLSQQNEYLKIKIQQNEKLISSYQTNHEQKLKKMKQQYGQELRASREKSQIQLEAIEAKYEKIKKSGKEKQSQMQKSLTQLEKELAIITQKNSNLIEKLKGHEQKQLNETQQHSNFISNLKNTLNKEKQNLKQQLENEQREKQRLQAQKNTLNANYQQQKLLLENRNKFLEQGKERYRQDYEDTKAKLELLIENSRKKWAQEKTSLELSHSQHVSKIQKKYWQQRQQLSENMKKQETDYQNKIRNLESQNRVLNQKLALQEQNKMGSQNVSDRKLKQMIENQKRLQIQLDRLRTTLQNEQSELHSQQRQKENLKAKLKESEQKCRALTNQKQHHFFEIQKQKAKWKAQKDGMQVKIDEHKQTIQRNDRQIQKLQRQNEKLKVEKKCQKSGMQPMTRFSSNFGTDRSRSTLEQSVLKQNSNNTSQISDTSIFFKD